MAHEAGVFTASFSLARPENRGRYNCLKMTRCGPRSPEVSVEYLVADREEAEQGLVIRKAFAVISISDPGKPIPKVFRPVHCLGVLHLAFNDAEPSESLPPSITLMSAEDAQATRSFVDRHHTAGAFLIHCEQGASRSPAVAAALCKAGGGDPTFYFENYQPNHFIFQRVLHAFDDSGRDTQETRGY